MPRTKLTSFVIFSVAIGIACERAPAPESASSVQPARERPPEPVVTYSGSDAAEGERIEDGEVILDIDEARRRLHAQHHPHTPLETRRLPGVFEPPLMDSVEDFAVSKDDLVVINPGPGEYVHVMEGQRHGYQNLTIGITYTAPVVRRPCTRTWARRPTCCSKARSSMRSRTRPSPWKLPTS